jgi:hypothetical protein
MSISSISGSSSNLWLQTLALQQRKGVEKHGPSLQADLKQLDSSLTSGDLDAARSDYATITSRLPTDARAQDTELASALSAVGAALDSGDLDAAREALANVQTAVKKHAAQGPPPPPPPDAQGTSASDGTTGVEDPIEELLSQLQDSLESNDLDSAKSTYERLDGFLKTLNGTSSDGSSASTSTSKSRKVDFLV